MSRSTMPGCVALTLFVACTPPSNGQDAVSADATVDAAEPADATDAQESALDLDAGSLDTPPVHVECMQAADCELPPELLACQSCQDGSSACPELRCSQHLCATLTPHPCAEQAAAACATDVDCPRAPCTLRCQGDGRSACLPALCIEGLCIPSHATCGLQLEPCPEGSKAGQECGECSAAGQCAFRVLGCFDACRAGAECLGGEACVGGLCQLIESCKPP